jgi:hypothetical protein
MLGSTWRTCSGYRDCRLDRERRTEAAPRPSSGRGLMEAGLALIAERDLASYCVPVGELGARRSGRAGRWRRASAPRLCVRLLPFFKARVGDSSCGCGVRRFFDIRLCPGVCKKSGRPSGKSGTSSGFPRPKKGRSRTQRGEDKKRRDGRTRVCLPALARTWDWRGRGPTGSSVCARYGAHQRVRMTRGGPRVALKPARRYGALRRLGLAQRAEIRPVTSPGGTSPAPSACPGRRT